MKKKIYAAGVSTLLGIALMFSFNTAEAACPATDCQSDCDTGDKCTITQYDNGVLCSTTTCYGRGPDFGNEQ